jgi:sugar lactone lactonase YvrE
MGLASVEVVTERVAPLDAGRIGGAPATAYPVGNRVGESPAWHAARDALFWIDVRRQQLLALQPGSGELLRWRLPEVVGASALCRSGRVWLALRHALAELDVETGRLRVIASVEADRPHNRLNDGKVSPGGRWFVFGSMDDRPHKQAEGALYRAAANGEIARLWQGLIVCNGIAFSPDATTIYFSDSAGGRIWRADWDEATGAMGEPAHWCGLDEARGRPDGALVDAAGHYWSAGVSAGCLNEIGGDGRIRRALALPCRAPTMPAFGGAGARTMYVTSLVRDQWDAPGPFDGALIAFPAPTTGEFAALLAD